MPLRVGERSSRTLDQRIAIRFPRLAAASSRLIARLPPTSRVGHGAQAVVRFAVEAYNRRDLGQDLEYYPYGEVVEAALAEPCYHGPSGYRRYIEATYDVWGCRRPPRADGAHRPRRPVRSARGHADASPGERCSADSEVRGDLDGQGRQGDPPSRLPGSRRSSCGCRPVRVGRPSFSASSD